ncbi:ring-1,2-phenylacetyl-CoA epoxidase subunit PaaB [Cytobacillus horneckiae]|uniref:1,2-phenylacetyl-CoA epoxidase subunit B n=1 Tax=Cytobacillus horneckiae TaxID=549687 RepID=A0A2N0ZIS3_9BACI|nr:1,2-phenylacetyl-CoA epoxidase subunit PaaB [Cytobacillus horneckiae]MBN6886653.1 1,2-phenylacetyl-CoA epoxidase subunit B [Cytobacillus horneckiae]MCM3177876.1 1,2-phenylacetyl-CoA epoxidase subunit B [Cytobacillus horneckiae]MEC1157318.1 1,2-phenylacetyl-CoA epoxidase subunit B [Cytobacillus horneckiae]MED2935801.1 1,2-phenylacetyl-CoA epoxidase subunit B [Cytobacillus horneckiae]PKG29386.1 1,2-phenylacetyl-CoA epoxidase subunit B [Cytobacillus horneckiae]
MSAGGFYQEFEVFSKRTDSTPLQYQFSLLAPNQELAFVMAQENFMRREPVADIWIVKRTDIRKMTYEEKDTLARLDNKDYRNAKGYGYLKKKWRKYEQNMLDEKEILSWGGEKKGEKD